MRRPALGYRDIESFETPVSHRGARGRNYIAVIGIDHYRAWSPLHNAVRDARGALNAFVSLGFLPFCEPILNQAATGSALRTLVTDRLLGLDRNDSLVMFFAGHGHTLPAAFSDDNGGRRGYLIPVDADGVDGSIGTWLPLDAWLSEITRLPPRHILVILDACHSGIALDPATRWRGDGSQLAAPLETLRARRSRRILTSALDDEVAMDGGPIPGHSLFTGCLIEALTGGLFASLQRPIASASELWSHVRQRVFAFATVKNWKQTPEFGRLDFDDHGELVVELPAARAARPEPRKGAVGGTTRARPARTPKVPMTGAVPAATEPPSVAQPTTARNARQGAVTRRSTPPPIVAARRGKHTRSAPPHCEAHVSSVVEHALSAPTAVSAVLNSARRAPPTLPGAAARADGTQSTRPASPERHALASDSRAEDAAVMAALDRHEAERLRGACVLSTLSGDPGATVTSWAAWAARRGYLTLVTECATLEAAVEDLLAQVPWLRSIPAARDRLAAAARLPVAEVDAALDARLDSERAAWIDEVAALDPHAQVSGWLLSGLRQPRARISDPATAPVQGAALLSILCDLAAPIAVLLHRAEPDVRWLEAAIRTAAALVTHMPRHSIAVAAPRAQTAEVLRGQDSAALSMARQGMVPIAVGERAPLVGHARSRAELVLHEALARDPRTAGQFALNVVVPVGERATVEVDLLAATARLAVEIDGWYHGRDPQAYRRDRAKDVLLQRAGFFVLRFLADDVDDRLALIVDEVAIAFAGRSTARHLKENTP